MSSIDASDPTRSRRRRGAVAPDPANDPDVAAEVAGAEIIVSRSDDRIAFLLFLRGGAKREVRERLDFAYDALHPLMWAHEAEAC